LFVLTTHNGIKQTGGGRRGFPKRSDSTEKLRLRLQVQVLGKFSFR